MAYGDRPPNCPPHIDAVDWNGEVWPQDQPFPMTPEECYWAMQGYAVLPASGPLSVDDFGKMIWLRVELVDGRLTPSS